MYKKERKREEEKNMVDYDFDLDSHTKLHIMGDCLYDYFNKEKEERSMKITEALNRYRDDRYFFIIEDMYGDNRLSLRECAKKSYYDDSTIKIHRKRLLLDLYKDLFER